MSEYNPHTNEMNNIKDSLNKAIKNWRRVKDNLDYELWSYEVEEISDGGLALTLFAIEPACDSRLIMFRHLDQPNKPLKSYFINTPDILWIMTFSGAKNRSWEKGCLYMHPISIGKTKIILPNPFPNQYYGLVCSPVEWLKTYIDDPIMYFMSGISSYWASEFNDDESPTDEFYFESWEFDGSYDTICAETKYPTQFETFGQWIQAFDGKYIDWSKSPICNFSEYFDIVGDKPKTVPEKMKTIELIK